MIFEQGARNFFNSTIQVLKLPFDRIIYALDTTSWIQNPKAVFTLINTVRGRAIYRHLNFAVSRQMNDFVTCTVEDINYVATSKDITIMQNMYVSRVNYSAAGIKMFHDLAKKYFNVDDNAGYFLDLGANIGTTGIYFCKKLAPNLKCLAFEPNAENFKLLRINTILNDMEDKMTLVNCGLGEDFDTMTMYISLFNPGANSVLEFYGDSFSDIFKYKNFKNPNDRPTETVKIIPLDAYLAENKIAPQEIKYIWIDTEGFEAKVLLGAKNLLAKNPAPVFMECNLQAWDNSGYFDDMLALLSEHYTHFICVQVDETIYPLNALKTMERPDNPLGRIGDIFLIRK